MFTGVNQIIGVWKASEVLITYPQRLSFPAWFLGLAHDATRHLSCLSFLPTYDIADLHFFSWRSYLMFLVDPKVCIHYSSAHCKTEGHIGPGKGLVNTVLMSVANI